MFKSSKNQFNKAELQVIDRMAMAFRLAVLGDDPKQCSIETERAIALIYAKKNPGEFIENIKAKASRYVERISIVERSGK